jgi:hypothetical protein
MYSGLRCGESSLVADRSADVTPTGGIHCATEYIVDGLLVYISNGFHGPVGCTTAALQSNSVVLWLARE